MINNTEDYVSLMKRRAAGMLPAMGSALRVTELISAMLRKEFAGTTGPEILDVGCAAGHFRRTFVDQNLPHSKYTGLEIDPGMIEAGREIWAREMKSGCVDFMNQDLETLDCDRKFDVVICVNAFMYFASAEKALSNLIRLTRRHLLVRSYFTDANYRIIRAQTTRNHDKSRVDEIDIFDDAGNMRCSDFWNIYSQTYIEAVVGKIAPGTALHWIEDRNVLSSLEAEKGLGIEKRGATEVLEGHEISYPFMLPWKWLAITVNSQG